MNGILDFNHFPILIRLVLSVTAWLGVTAIYGQSLTMDSQSRSVFAEAFADVVNAASDSESETVFSPGFFFFADDAFAGAVSNNGIDLAQSNSTAEQVSLIQFLSVEAFGETNLFANVNNGPSRGSAHGAAVSDFAYTFTLSTPTDFTVLGQIHRFGSVSDAGIALFDASMNSIFAIGEPGGYAQSQISSSGILAAGTYTLVAFADSEHTYLGPSHPMTSGAEHELLFSLDLDAPGEIVNGSFHQVSGFSDLFGWTTSGAGSAGFTEVGGNSMLLMETGSPVSVMQIVDTLADPFRVRFDYEFLDTAGRLEVWLDSQLLATLDAPGTLSGMLQSFEIEVHSIPLLDLVDIPLQFTFDGPSAGLQMRLDNVSMSLVPEPASALLMGVFVAGWAGLGRTRWRR